ncbi:MAG: hypothetical protein K6U02_00125 [Firmicutes bacterium]|nr:hypothetical protein [Bacillota bacterium]
MWPVENHLFQTMLFSNHSQQNAMPQTIWALIACIVVVQILTLTPGVLLNDDGALYLTHARNIAHGKPYSETLFIYTTQTARYSPASYPPIWPLVLAPIYFFFGLDPDPFKWLNIGILALLATVVWLAYRRVLSPKAGIALAALIGFNPYLTGLKNTVFSELLFLLLAFLTFYASRLRLGILCGIAAYFAYGTRPLGALILLSVIFADIIDQKKLTAFSLKVGLIATSLIVLQNLVVRSELEYITIATLGEHSIQENFRFYVGIMSIFLAGDMHIIVRSIVLGLTCGLAVVGIWRSVRIRLEAEHVFLAIYGLFILLWPIHQARYLLPLLPVLLLYAVRTIRYELSAVPLILVALIASFGWRPEIREHAPLKFYQRVKVELPIDSVFVGSTPRALALYAERRAARYPETGDVREYLRRLQATHLFTCSQDSADWKQWAESLGHRLFEEDGCTVWKLDASLAQKNDSAAGVVAIN